MANTGTQCKNARFRYLITDPSAGYASIATGADPSAHGIVADFWYDRLTNRIIYSIDDAKQSTVEGSYGTGPYSPVALHSRTLSDELRVKSRFRSRSIGVSMDPKAAILMAGHTATGAYWMDPVHANWITSRQIEAGRRAIVHHLKRGGKVWIRIFPDKPVTSRPPEVRMGKGKGAVDHWVAVVKPGRILYEIGGINESLAREALKLAAQKLPIRVQIVTKTAL